MCSITIWTIFFQRHTDHLLQSTLTLTPGVQRVSVRQRRAGQPLAHRLQRGHHAPLLQVPHRLLPPLRTLRRRVLDLIHYSTSGIHNLNCNILTTECNELSVKDKGPIKYWYDVHVQLFWVGVSKLISSTGSLKTMIGK